MFTCLVSLIGSYDYAYATPLDRPTISTQGVKPLSVWLQINQFNDNLDILNYSKKFPPKAAKLNSYDGEKVGINYEIMDNLSISYSLQKTTSDVTRFTEPKKVTTTIYAQHLRGQYKILSLDDWQIALEAGLRKHTSPEVNLYKYDFAQFQVTWPGHALVTLSSEDSAKLIAVRGQWSSDAWTLHYGFEYRDVEVMASMTSESSLVTQALASQAPQSTPWKEKHYIHQLSIDYTPVDYLTLALDYQNYNIKRIGYIPRAKKIDYNRNETVDVYLTWNMTEQFQPYFHAYLSKRSSLGEAPLSYNQRTNHKFKYPFGYVSLGMQLTF